MIRLSDEFLNQYRWKPNPFPHPIGEFTFYRSYSRYKDESKEREMWWETVRRAVEYNCNLVPNVPMEEAEELFDNVYNLRYFFSGRTFWVGGTPVAYKYPMANFNCAFTITDKLRAFYDTFYLLMVGSGVGLRMLKNDIEKLPRFRKDAKVTHKTYKAVKKAMRQEHTTIDYIDGRFVITIGDSKEGWRDGLEFLFTLLTESEAEDLEILINYDNIRPKGELLKTFGGFASGHQSLKIMLEKIMKVVNKSDRGWLKPIDTLDIACIIGEAVVAGGTRRTALMILIDPDDKECIEAKSNLYSEVNGELVINKDIAHRRTSNNSILYYERPSDAQIKWQIETMRHSGEPAFINLEAGRKRKPTMQGVNPCGEVLLEDEEMCNLVVLNLMAFVTEDGFDWSRALRAMRLLTRLALRMASVEFELPHWVKDDTIVGVSMTGIQDAFNVLKASKYKERFIYQDLRKSAHDEVVAYAKQIGIPVPKLVTTLKPEGTITLMPTVSSGIHYSHSEYTLRRVRISKDNPLLSAVTKMGFSVEDDVADENLAIINFPLHSPKGKTKADVSAIEQLNGYKQIMTDYVDHNCSITVHVRDDEWDGVTKWMIDNWDDVVGISFIPYSDASYPQMPFEAITESEYLELVKRTPRFEPSVLTMYEKEHTEFDLEEEDPDCATGACPIR